MKITNFWKLSTILFGVIISTLLCANASRGDDIRAAVVAGQQAPIFKVKTIDGKSVNFPADYKGKVVLLDFWATWCPPCRAELPNVVATYQKYHDKGFDVLSVSLDEPMNGPALLQFVHDHNMTWPQIYDGQYWNAAVAVEYGVHAIPCPVLVDGDTGMIMAVGVDALGQSLAYRIEARLAAKARLEKIAPDVNPIR
jgi:thiol-disulfide isomerase/thioredoxin